MLVKFSGQVEIPDDQVDSYCDLERYLFGLFQDRDENTDEYFERLKLGYEVL